MQTSQRIRLLNIDDQIDDSVGIMKSDDFVNSFRDFSMDESKILGLVIIILFLSFQNDLRNSLVKSIII